MIKREKKKVAKKTRVAPDLRGKEKRPNSGNAERIVKKRKGFKATQSKAISERLEEACEEGFRIHFT